MEVSLSRRSRERQLRHFFLKYLIYTCLKDSVATKLQTLMAKRTLDFSDVGTSVDVKAKRHTKEEVLSPKKIKTADAHATLHALVMSMSPLKKKGTYFDGELTDGDEVTRIVGFDKAQQQKLEKFYTEKIPVILTNCEIKRNKFNNRLEVVLRSYSKIEKSDVNFEIEDSKTIGSELIELKDLGNKEEYDKITVRAQVIKLADPAQVSRGLTKQEVTIADSTEATILTLWEEDINKLSLGQTYQFNRVIVRTYRGKRQLSFPPSGASVEEIEDFNEVVDDSYDLDHDNLVEGAKVIGVSELGRIYICVQCKKGTVQRSPENAKIGCCQQCNTIQCLSLEKQTCKLLVEARGEHVSVRAYGEMMKAIVNTESEDISCEDLLSAPLFDFKYNDYHVVTSISRAR